MIEAKNLRRVLLYCLIGALAVGAVTGIAVFILGDFGELEMKILVSTLSLTFFSVTALASTAVLETKRGALLSGPGLVLSLLGLGWSLAVIWPEWDSEFAVKAMVILIIFAFSFAQSCLLALPRLRGGLVWLFPAAMACIFSLAGLISVMVIFEWDDELLFRMVGVLGILDAGSTLAIPILYKLVGGTVPGTAEPQGEPEGKPVQIALACPQCGRQGTYPLGKIECPGCSLRIRVEIDRAAPQKGGEPPRPGRFQFSLKTILLVFLAVSLPLGWVGYRLEQLRRQVAVIEALAPLNPHIYYRYGNARNISFTRVDPSKFDASLLARLRELPDLEYLQFQDVPITDDDLVYLEGLDLQWAQFERTRLSSACAERLKMSHPNWHVSVEPSYDQAETAEPAAEPTE